MSFVGTSYNITIPGTSPVLDYKPYAVGRGLDDGWTTFYSQLGFIDSPGVQLGDTGVGTSYHITSLQGANVSLSFNGTGITLSGYSNCSYEVFLDGQLAKSSNSTFINGTLFSQNALNLSLHTIALVSAASAASGQQLAFDSALIQSVSDSSTFLIDKAQINATNTTAISYGGWSETTDNNVPVPGQPPLPFYQTDVQGASATFQFSGGAIEVHGDLNFGHGQYIVDLDGSKTTLNGSSFFKVSDTILFYQSGLSAAQVHTLNLTNLSGDNETLTLNWFTVYDYNALVSDSSNTTGGSSTTSTAATITTTTSSSSSPTTSTSSAHMLKIPTILGALLVTAIAAVSC